MNGSSCDPTLATYVIVAVVLVLGIDRLILAGSRRWDLRVATR